MTEFKKYKHKESGEIVEAGFFTDDTPHYCVYPESSGEKIWGEDWEEEYFLEQYELIEIFYLQSLS